MKPKKVVTLKIKFFEDDYSVYLCEKPKGG